MPSQAPKPAAQKKQGGPKPENGKKKGKWTFLNRNLQWWGGLLGVIAGVAGFLFSVYTVYYGIRAYSSDDRTFSTLMTEYNMTLQQIAVAIMVVGSILLLYYLATLLVAWISMISSKRKIRRRTLFIVSIIFFCLDMVFYLLGNIDLWLAVLTGAADILMTIGIYLNFTPVLKRAM